MQVMSTFGNIHSYNWVFVWCGGNNQFWNHFLQSHLQNKTLHHKSNEIYISGVAWWKWNGNEMQVWNNIPDKRYKKYYSCMYLVLELVKIKNTGIVSIKYGFCI